jgi:hypothetical protein
LVGGLSGCLVAWSGWSNGLFTVNGRELQWLLGDRLLGDRLLGDRLLGDDGSVLLVVFS